MSIKSIFTPFLDDENARIAFQGSATVAHKFNAHIAAVFMRQRPLYSGVVYFPLGGAYPVDDDDSIKRAEENNVADLRLKFDDSCDEHGVAIVDIEDHDDDKSATASWRDLKGRIPEDLAKAASAFDLVSLTTPGNDESKFQWRLVEELMFASGRPVLISPQNGFMAFPKRVVVAWDGGVESASAVAAALPFLKQADMVKLLTVHEPSKETASTKELAACLRLHGIETSETEIELEKGQHHIDVLVHEIVEACAELVVMGAYSHSRWREAVLGGFTRHMLKNATTPLLLAR